MALCHSGSSFYIHIIIFGRHPSIYMSACLLFYYLAIYQSNQLSIYLSVYLAIYLLFDLSRSDRTFVPFFLPINVSSHLSIHPVCQSSQQNLLSHTFIYHSTHKLRHITNNLTKLTFSSSTLSALLPLTCLLFQYE